MDTNSNQAAAPQGGVDSAKAGASKSTQKQIAVESLSRKARDKYSSIYHRYKEEALIAVLFFKRKAISAWIAFVLMSDLVNNSENDIHAYYQTLTNAFEVGESYTKDDIVQTVCSARAVHKFSSFATDVSASCFEEFEKVYLYEEDSEPNANKVGKHRVYRPVFALLAD